MRNLLTLISRKVLYDNITKYYKLFCIQNVVLNKILKGRTQKVYIVPRFYFIPDYVCFILININESSVF